MKVLLVLILPAVLFVTVQAVSRQKYGQAIFFDLVAVSETACGKPYKDTDLVAIVSPKYFQSRSGNPEKNVCGRKLKVKNTQNGKTVTVEIQDNSKDIKNLNNIGLTKAGIKALGGKANGKNIKVSWHPLSDDTNAGGTGGSGDSANPPPPSGGNSNGANPPPDAPPAPVPAPSGDSTPAPPA